MASAPNSDTLLLGGRPHRDVPATYGEMTLSEIDRFLADYAVISPVGVHADRGATDYELHEAEVARAMMRLPKKSRRLVATCTEASTVSGSMFNFPVFCGYKTAFL